MNGREVIIIVAIVAAMALFLLMKSTPSAAVVHDICLDHGIENGILAFDFTTVNLLKSKGNTCFPITASLACCTKT